MHEPFRLIAVALALAAVGCAQVPPPRAPAASLSLIPLPARLEPATGSFVVDARTPIVAEGAEALPVAEHLRQIVRESRGLDLRVASAAPRGPAIRLVLDPRLGGDSAHRDEAYELVVTPTSATLTAAQPHGLFNGTITLWQLLTQDTVPTARIAVPALRIVDAPRFAWRGLLLDSARHYQPPQWVERFIDEMSKRKLDVLHWHLSDDQGWRVEIRKYPELTRIGGWRAPLPDERRLVDPATGLYGGWYTQEQIREIVAYAAARFVTIVPEIDMPGHAQAAIAAYPQHGVTGRRPPVSSKWGIHTWLYNVDEDTFAFLGDVLGEVMDLFPSAYIHVGGDEAAKDQWQASAAVQRRMRELGLANETALQGWFTARLQKILAARGRRLVGWDEILEGGLPPGAVVMSWRGSAGAIAAASHGDDVVLAPDPQLYLDHLQGGGPDQPPGRVVTRTLADVYAFDPVPKELDAVQLGHVLGAQANLWSEYMTTGAAVEFAAFPRAAALAERLWTPPAQVRWSDFLARLPGELRRFRAAGVNASDDAFAPRIGIEAAASAFRVALARQVDLGTMRYTLDGSEPSATSPEYRAPFDVAAGTMLRAASFLANQRLSATHGETIDGQTVRRRHSDALKPGNASLLLRLEGAPPANGSPPRYNVDLMNPSWIYERIDFDALRGIDARVGALPYFFELWHDAARVVRRPAGGKADELQLRLDRCDGSVVASAAVGNDEAEDVSMPVDAIHGVHDACFTFGTHGDDPLRLIDWIEPIRR